MERLALRRDLGQEGRWPLKRVRRLLASGGVGTTGPFVQIAGTNGKGSVCALLERGFRGIGLRTGLYTSPHLIRWNERIRINGGPIDNSALRNLLTRWMALADRLGKERPSGFEIFTAIALDHFQREGVDVAILEVGLGGRCDATSAVDTELSAIVSIGLDHCDVLGSDLASIAREKAAIARPAIPLVLGAVPREARAVISAAASAVAAHLIRPEHIILPPLPYLRGCEQERNGPLAATVGRLWLKKCGREKDFEDFLAAMALARWPGRWDRRTIDGRRWIFDCTHNGAGLEVFRKNWQRLPSEEKSSPTVVAGTLGRERARDLLPHLASIAAELILVHMNEERSVSTEELRTLIPPSCRCRIRTAEEGQLAKILPSLCGQPTLVTGSIYLVGKAFAALAIDPFGEKG